MTAVLHSVDEARGRFPNLPQPVVADALPDGPELERALAFLRRTAVGSATRAEPFRFGTLLSDPDRPAIWDRNFALLEDLGPDVEADAIAAELDLVQAHLRHRKAVSHDEAAAIRLAPGFRDLGWQVNRYLVMVLAAEPPPARQEVVEVAEAEVEVALLPFIREEDEPESEEIQAQLVSMLVPLREVVDVRAFAHREEGVPVSWCELYSDGTIGQVEDVATLRAYRGRGYASSVVAAAVRASLAAGHDLTFLTVGELDGPRALYERLGFEALGREHVFFRPPA